MNVNIGFIHLFIFWPLNYFLCCKEKKSVTPVLPHVSSLVSLFQIPSVLTKKTSISK